MMKQTRKMTALLSMMLLTLPLVGCGSQNAGSDSVSVSSSSVEGEHSHVWDEGVQVKAADCGSPAMMKYTCTICHETKELPFGKAQGSHKFQDHVCEVCGYVDMSSMTQEEAISQYGYYHLDKDQSETINVSDRLFYGSYPQSEVKDSAKTATLNASLDDAQWTSYGYSCENAVSDFMQYQDVISEGKKYRAVKATALRPYQIDVSSDNSFMSQNGYDANQIYWFEFDALEWIVLDYYDGKAMLQTLHAVDAQSFSSTYTKDGASYLNADQTYVNNWESSYIRQFLNSKFYGWAFDSAQQAKISVSALDHSTTSYSLNNEFATCQNDTEDRMFLLSYQDTLNERYQFPNVESESMSGEANGAVSVCKSGTAYALSQGLRISNQTQNEDGEPCSWWMLRSAGGKNYSVCGISKYGTITKSNTVTYTAGKAKEQDGTCFYTAEGIAPAMMLKLGK